MVGKISVIPYGTPVPGITDVFGSDYSHYRIRIGDFVWLIAISPVVKSISDVKVLKGVGNLNVSLVYELNGRLVTEDEILCLGYDAETELCSKAVFDLIKAVDGWELGV